jgi:hypothetical protein
VFEIDEEGGRWCCSQSLAQPLGISNDLDVDSDITGGSRDSRGKK